MIAYKTYADCPSEERPLGVVDAWPWWVDVIEPEQQAEFEANGFTVLTDESYAEFIALYQTAIDAWAANPPTVPTIMPVSSRQIRLALLISGVSLQMITDALNSLYEPQRSMALVEWEYATTFERSNPLVSSVATSLGWTSEQLDDLWLFASTL